MTDGRAFRSAHIDQPAPPQSTLVPEPTDNARMVVYFCLGGPDRSGCSSWSRPASRILPQRSAPPWCQRLGRIRAHNQPSATCEFCLWLSTRPTPVWTRRSRLPDSRLPVSPSVLPLAPRNSAHLLSALDHHSDRNLGVSDRFRFRSGFDDNRR